jgi:DNA-binding transcriptional LysR family regulator
VGFVRQRTGRPRPLELRRGKEVVVVEGRHDFVTDDGDAYLAAGVAGLGVITAPDYMTAAHMASGELTPLLEGWSAAPMPLVALSPPNRHVNERLRVFVDWVASLVARGVTRPGTRPRRASRQVTSPRLLLDDEIDEVSALATIWKR